MADAEREDSYYHPGGVPVTPQARRFGYEFPVYVSEMVWRKTCIAHGIPTKHGVNLEKRIWHLLQYCYDGMTKKLAATDDFLYYEFKVYFWDRDRPNATKMQRWKLGARLFLDPSTGTPWMYIFAPNVDSIDTLEAGTAPSEEPVFEEPPCTLETTPDPEDVETSTPEETSLSGDGSNDSNESR